ncbi:Cytochrome P450 [Canna indica]|uniref:Cytochrome P450 n=1 Tax=Canna indica TaxID=4628 RepID=A0AAQ3KBH9_9LILI|nr:Cytochrome P450 [Canna indica]
MFGDGIFAVDGDKWRHQRKLASFGFSTKVLRDFSGVIFKSNAAKLAHVFSSYATSNEKFDIQDLFMKSTMDSIFRIGFGVELNCLEGSGRHGIEFAETFDAGNELIVIRYLNPFWKIVRYLNIGSEATLKMKIKLVDKYLYELINIRIQQLSSIGNKSSNKEDILSKFIEESIKDPERMTLQYLRDIVLNFVIAGKDTTAGTLSWFFYLICKNPHVQEKIYKEVKEAIEADEDVTFDAFSSSINDESLHKMHYLHAALSETLRIFPPAAMDSKVCFSDDILPGGYNVRKGDIVYYQPYAMGRMEYLWGKDAESFCPERWLDDNGIFQPENPYKFPAFQAGPRICLGKEFAYRQMKIFAAVLVRFFKFKLSDEKKVVQYKVTTTLLINEGLFFSFINGRLVYTVSNDVRKPLRNIILQWDKFRRATKAKHRVDTEAHLNSLCMKVDSGTSISDPEIIEVKDLKASLDRIYAETSSYWVQRAKKRWLKDGDRNTRYFHLCASHRRKVNWISSLQIQGRVVFEQAEIASSIRDFYRDLFGREMKPHLNIKWKSLYGSPSLNINSLDDPFTLTEVFEIGD